MTNKITIPKDKIAQFCKSNHISRLAVFGSALRDDFRPESDIDVLVDFIPGHTPGFFHLVEIEEELTNIFGGHKVDLRTPQDLSRYFRNEIIANAEVQYVQR
jgi:predicted nucleotidyltransferase